MILVKKIVLKFVENVKMGKIFGILLKILLESRLLDRAIRFSQCKTYLTEKTFRKNLFPNPVGAEWFDFRCSEFAVLQSIIN